MYTILTLVCNLTWRVRYLSTRSLLYLMADVSAEVNFNQYGDCPFRQSTGVLVGVFKFSAVTARSPFVVLADSVNGSVSR